jgi:hypothetical protein
MKWGCYFPRERASTMSSPSAICVYYYFSTCETGIGLGTANDEAATWIDVVYCFIVQEMVWDDLEDFLHDFGLDIKGGDLWRMLG